MGFLAPISSVLELWPFPAVRDQSQQEKCFPVGSSLVSFHSFSSPFGVPLHKTPTTNPAPHAARPPSPPASLQHKEQSPVQLISVVTGICKFSLLFNLSSFIISRQHSLAFTLMRPSYICITGHFVFVCQTFVSCPTLAMMLTMFLFAATEAAVI